MDGILGYPSLPRQQLLALDPNIYGGEPFRHGLTPPQLSSEQLHSYGKAVGQKKPSPQNECFDMISFAS